MTAGGACCQADAMLGPDGHASSLRRQIPASLSENKSSVIVWVWEPAVFVAKGERDGADG